MTLKQRLAGRFAPPFLTDWLFPSAQGTVPIWSGVYPDLKSVPISGAGFRSPTWIDQSTEATAAAQAAFSQSGALPAGIPAFRSMLSLLAAAVYRSKGALRILDFGGGMGIAFADVLNSAPSIRNISHIVVDNEGLCEAGERLFQGDSRIQFCSTLPRNIDNIDICFLGSVLQYIEDYRGLVSTLAELQPDYFLLGFTPAGNIPTFATAQHNVPASTIAMWFFNVVELNHIFRDAGYDVLFQTTQCDRTFDMTNFPTSHRLAHMCHLLYARNNE